MSDLKLSERMRVAVALGDGIRLDRAAALEMIRAIEKCETVDARCLSALANMRAFINRTHWRFEMMVRDMMLISFCICCIAVVL
ncbi:hypothetical protein [Paracoccus sp. (in: a-proteobacteria)]|uniref:hypothetical protein n=1 Tax=Paracoccus sp. TaxID=267 RepID=UPI0028AD2BE2|nr:hypothetical protein [Paracoccus sp. (in: a-proteobacteria)]